jgi:hypothetical protein
VDLIERRDARRPRPVDECHAHLNGGTLRLHRTDTGAEAATNDRLDVDALARENDRSECKVRVERLRNALGHAHGRRDDQNRPARVASFDEFRGSDGKLAVMAFDNSALHALLDREAEFVADRSVETTIHDAKTVCRTDHRAGRFRCCDRRPQRR